MHEERWILEHRSRNGTWRKIPNSDTWETGEDANVELRRYKEADLSSPNSAFRIRRVKALNENPDGSGLVTGVLVVAAIGITYLLFREKPGKEKTPPLPTPPTPVGPFNPDTGTPFGGKPKTTLPFIPVTFGCLISEEQFKAWGEKAVRSGPWLPQVMDTPPNADALKAQFPEFAPVSNLRLATVTNNGTKLWLYNGFGVPAVNAAAQKNLCDWIADPNTPVIAT